MYVVQRILYMFCYFWLWLCNHHSVLYLSHSLSHFCRSHAHTIFANFTGNTASRMRKMNARARVCVSVSFVCFFVMVWFGSVWHFQPPFKCMSETEMATQCLWCDCNKKFMVWLQMYIALCVLIHMVSVCRCVCVYTHMWVSTFEVKISGDGDGVVPTSNDNEILRIHDRFSYGFYPYFPSTFAHKMTFSLLSPST